MAYYEVEYHRKIIYPRYVEDGRPFHMFYWDENNNKRPVLLDLPGGMKGRYVDLRRPERNYDLHPSEWGPSFLLFQLDGTDATGIPFSMWPLYPDIFRVFTYRELGVGFIETWSIFTEEEEREESERRKRGIK